MMPFLQLHEGHIMFIEGPFKVMVCVNKLIAVTLSQDVTESQITVNVKQKKNINKLF